MSKTRDTGFLGNVIKVDTSGNVSFVSGSTTLATLNTSGQLSGSSPVLSSSYALNAETLDGLDSTVFTLTSSFAAQTASFTAFTSSILSYTESANSRFSSIETVTGSNITRLSALEAATGSLYSYTSSLNNKTSSFATTGSNTFEGIQTINSNLVVTGSITAQTLVVQTITSSVDFVTGSTRFGSILANTHVFSGSVTMNPNGLFVSSSGNVGIGTITPSNILTVVGGAVSPVVLNLSNANSNCDITMTSGAGGGLVRLRNNLDDFQIHTNGVQRLTIASTGIKFGNVIGDIHSITGSVGISGSLTGVGATFSNTITTANNGGTSVNITTNGNNGTSASPLQTNVNFYGYNGNLNGQIRVDDIAGTAQIGTMKFYTWNSAQVLALTLAQTGAATFSSTIASTGATFSGDLNLSGSAEINHTGRMLFDAGAGNGFLFRVNNVATQALSIDSTGSATFPVSAIATKFNTFSGNVSVPYNTATLLQTCTADNGNGSMYLIIAAIGGAGTENIAMGILVNIAQGGGTARWAFQNNGAQVVLTDPASNGIVYVTQTKSGSAQTVNYSVLRIG